jgi:aspartate dehydrogenase
MSESEVVAFVGWGAISKRVAELLAERKSCVKIGAIAVRDRSASREGIPAGAVLIEDPAELAATGASLVVEAAGRPSVFAMGRSSFLLPEWISRFRRHRLSSTMLCFKG